MPRTGVVFYQEVPGDVPLSTGCAGSGGQTVEAMRSALRGCRDSPSWDMSCDDLRRTSFVTESTGFERDADASITGSCTSSNERKSRCWQED